MGSRPSRSARAQGRYATSQGYAPLESTHTWSELEIVPKCIFVFNNMLFSHFVEKISILSGMTFFLPGMWWTESLYLMDFNL